MTQDTTRCPICGWSECTPTVSRHLLPAMQNYVYPDRTSAMNAPSGKLQLYECPSCSFSYNGAFDEALMTYDSGYDNSVPSQVMDRYYEELAIYLHAKYSLAGQLLVDVGCGKGTFLKTMCRLFPDVRGIGIDPSYEGPLAPEGSSLRFIPERFSQGSIDERPALVVCRHVLEHIAAPREFLASIREALRKFEQVPILIEVPDTAWILENRAFWDFCYEHCNYFTSSSLASALRRTGFPPAHQSLGYGGQYLRMEARCSAHDDPPIVPLQPDEAERFQNTLAYATAESRTVEEVKGQLNHLKEAGKELVLWGLATKGVMFCLLVDPNLTLIKHCIDINERKQGCYVPVTGHRIENPEVLSALAGRDLAVIVMNPNYADEIRLQCKSLGLSAMLLDAYGAQLGDSP